ncbi:MAG: LysM peptidoglycan-binding domain-containing M23 family metallopeptidase [Candidatus Binatia bacterium]
MACGAERGGGIHHTVGRGENLFRIGKAYGVPYRELARTNEIADPGKIEIGQRIFIPGATRRLPVEIIAPRFASERAPTAGELPIGERPFRWPTRVGRLSSRFGPRNGSFHDGIDIAAPEGTPVYAARGGRVIYSDSIPGYGNIVIIDHLNGLLTVYAHNAKNHVEQGEMVKAGDEVSLVGSTGRTTGPNLHFEVRQQNVARNPLFYLPPLDH